MTGVAGPTGTSDAHPVFTGVRVALVTLFDNNADVDAKATAGLAGQLVETGVSAVVVAGTTGEAATLNEAERAALIREVRSAVPVDVPVLGGVGASCGRLAAAYATAAVDAGAGGPARPLAAARQ
jgi:4-hydroxy-tetrahydrodipicolinate synthase